MSQPCPPGLSARWLLRVPGDVGLTVTGAVALRGGVHDGGGGGDVGGLRLRCRGAGRRVHVVVDDLEGVGVHWVVLVGHGGHGTSGATDGTRTRPTGATAPGADRYHYGRHGTGRGIRTPAVLGVNQ